MDTCELKFWASSRSLGGVANLALVAASRVPSAGWRRELGCFHGANRGQPPVGRVHSPEGRSDTVGVCALYLPQDTFVFGGCLHARHPACCYARFRAELSWEEPSRAETSGLAGLRASRGGTRGLVRCYYRAARVSGVSLVWKGWTKLWTPVQRYV